jgi:uncharacterized delta-60 repeat protein
MRSLISRWSALLYLAVIFGPNLAYAAAGSLDPTFGQGGKVVTNFGSSLVVANAALQTDGSIVVLISNNSSNFALVRYLSNGSRDTSFGTGGVAQTIFASFNFPHSLSIQSDGSIVVTGIASNDQSHFEFVAARFHSNGSLDSTFGVGGQATAPVTGDLSQSVSLIQPDGKILLAGPAPSNFRQPNTLAMARFNSNGSLDSTFGANGSVEQTSVGAFCSSLGLDSQGHIFTVAGRAIAEFTPNGRPLAQVTPAAIVTSSQGGAPLPTAFQPDGRYVFAEGLDEGNVRQRDADTQVVRFTATGGIDSTFNNPTFDFIGEGGTFTNDVTTAIAIQPNGQIVLGAAPFDASVNNQVFALARLNTNGSRDSRFGSNGIVITNIDGADGVTALLVQPDGKIVAIGPANSFSDLALARFLGQ